MPHRFAVWRTSSRFSDGYSYSSTFSAAQDARWPSPQADLANMAIVSDPTQTSGKAALCEHARSRRMPEVITSRAPATECLHAHARVARMSWLLYTGLTPGPRLHADGACTRSVVPRSEPPSPGSPHGATPNVEIRCSSSTRTVGVRACMGLCTCSSFTGKPPKRSFKSNPR